MALTKSQIVEELQAQLGLQRNQCIELLETFLEIIKRDLASGNNVMISGFGKFCVHEKKKRKGRNPATGEDMMLDARRVVTFKSSGILKEKVNGNE